MNLAACISQVTEQKPSEYLQNNTAETRVAFKNKAKELIHN